MIPQTFIQELLSRVDAVEVVGRHVQLKKAGANYLGLCPFHGEKSPSFTVSPTKQFYHCFGCGAHGSAIGFLIEYAGLSFPEAVRDLAQSVGLAVPETREDPAESGRRDPDLLALMGLAARFYRDRLKDSPRAIDYLKGRGLSGQTASRYAIGYAPDQWRGLQAAVPDYDAPTLLTTGLVIDSEAADGRHKRFDRFRDRIMFPIRNARGQVIGFGGRVIDQGEPKYMNSPETPLFSKGRELYGLFEAREALRQTNCAVVVEGYMDVVMLAQHGIGYALATLGTSTTPDHLRKLLRLVDRVVFAFDGDSAGRKAAWRALQACLPMVSDTKRLDFLFLPPEHDPDSYVRAHGSEGFAALLNQTRSLSEFLLQELGAQVDLELAEGRARFLSEARTLLLSMPATALRLQLLHRVAQIGRVSNAELQAYLDQAAAEAQRRPAGAAAEAGARPGHWGGEEGFRRAGTQAGALPGRGASSASRRPGTSPERRSAGLTGYPPRARARRPDLLERARLLTALHPCLASEPFEPDFLPSELLDWLAAVRELPLECSFAALCEGLREREPVAVAALERDAAQGQALALELPLEEARAEFSGALSQLKSRAIRAEIDALVAKGSLSESDRERLRLLQAFRIRA